MSVGQTQFFSSAFPTFHAKSILDHDGKQKAEGCNYLVQSSHRALTGGTAFGVRPRRRSGGPTAGGRCRPLGAPAPELDCSRFGLTHCVALS